MAKIRPLGNRILVEEEKKTATPSGIVLPDSAQEETLMAKVLAVGKGPRSPMTGEVAPITEVSEGDYVMYSRHVGTELKFGDNTVLALREEDLIAVLDVDRDEEI